MTKFNRGDYVQPSDPMESDAKYPTMVVDISLEDGGIVYWLYQPESNLPSSPHPTLPYGEDELTLVHKCHYDPPIVGLPPLKEHATLNG